MANGSTRYIIKYVGDITDVLAKIRAIRRATNTLGRSGARNIAPLTQSIERTVAPLNKMAAGAKNATGGMKGLFLRALKTIPIWLALRAGVTAFTAVVRSSIGFLVTWETQLAQVRVVGEATAGQMKVLSQGLLNLQKTLGVSNKDLGEGAKLYRQQGRAIEEIIPLLDATARLSLITGRNITQSVEDLTAILKAFNIEASDSVTIVDKLTAVTLQNAITGGDLASGLKQSASTAATFGIELNELIGFITAIQTQTRDSGNTVGRALRTIFVRLGTVAIDTAQQVAKVPFFLDELGRVTTAKTPKLRNLTSVITELAAKFKTLETAERAQLAASVAGVRRSNQITALFQNYDQFIRAQVQASFGLGEADRAIGILTSTTASKIEQVKGAWNSMLDVVANTSGFKRALDDVKSQLEGLSFILNPTGAVSTGLIAQLGKDVEQFTRQSTGIKAVFKEIENLKELNASINRDPDNEGLIGFSIVRVKELQSAISRFENENVIDLQIEGLNEVKNTFDLLTLLEGKAPALREILIDVIVNEEVAGARRGLASTFGQIQADFDAIATNTEVTLGGSARALRQSGTDVDGILEKIQKRLSNIKNVNEVIANSAQIGDILTDIGAPAQDVDNIVRALAQLEKAQERVTHLQQEGRDEAEESLKIAEIARTNSIVEGQIKERLLAIDLEAIRAGSSQVDIIAKKLALLNDVNAQLNPEQEAIRDNLEKELARVEASKLLALAMSDENAILVQMKANGASVLAIESQRLKFIKARKGAESIETINQENKIREASIQREAELQSQLLSVAGDLVSLEGQRTSEVIQTQIELEKRLNIERKGIDGLKQQVALLKALKSEQKSVNKEAQLSNLQKAIAGARREQSPALSQRNALQESRLRSQAQSLGIDADDFLFDNSDLISETEKNIQSLLSNTDSTHRLADSIDHLAGVFARQEVLSAEQVSRARSQVSSGNVSLNRVGTSNLLPQTTIGPLPAITNVGRSFTGSGTPTFELNVGNTEVTVNANATDADIQAVVEEQLDVDNERRKVAIANQIAELIRTPGTAPNLATRGVVREE